MDFFQSLLIGTDLLGAREEWKKVQHHSLCPGRMDPTAMGLDGQDHAILLAASYFRCVGSKQLFFFAPCSSSYSWNGSLPGSIGFLIFLLLRINPWGRTVSWCCDFCWTFTRNRFHSERQDLKMSGKKVIFKPPKMHGKAHTKWRVHISFMHWPFLFIHHLPYTSMIHFPKHLVGIPF